MAPKIVTVENERQVPECREVSEREGLFETEHGPPGKDPYPCLPAGLAERRFSLSSLRARLMLLVLLAVLPAFVLALYNGMEYRRQSAESSKREAMRLAQLVAMELKQLIDGARQVVISLAQLREVRRNELGECSLLFANLAKQYPQYTHFGMADLDGNIVCSSVATTSDHINIADRAYFLRALQARDFSIGNYQIDRITQKATLNFGYPIFNDSGQIQSVLFAALDLLSLNRFAAEAGFHKGERLTVRDGNGTILVRYPDPETWVGHTDPEAPILKAILSHKSEGTAEAAGIDGVTCLYAFTPLFDLPKGGVYLSMGIPASLAYGEADHRLKMNLICLAIVALLVVIVAWFAGDVFVLRQVRALIHATRRLAVGDLGIRTGMAYGSGELGYLAYVLDTMAEFVEQSVKELQRARAEYRALVEEIPAVTYSAVVDGDLRFLYISPQVEMVTGFSVSEWASDPDIWESRLHAEDRARALASVHGCRAAGESYGVEYRFSRRDGSEVWIRDEGKVVGRDGQSIIIRGIMRDVGERKLAEKALRESEERFKAQYQSIPVPTFTWRRKGDDLVLSDHNRAAQAASRGNLAHYLGRTAAGMYPNRPEILEDMNRCLDGRTTIKREIFAYRPRPESREKDYVVTYAYVPPDLVMVHREDITEQRKLEKMVLMREKMAALGNVAAGIAHEIRNPLSGINIYLHTLDKICSSRGSMDEVEEVIGELKSASGKIENVIKRVLNFARPGQPKLDMVNLNKHIEDAMKLAAVILHKNDIVLETSLDAGLPTCYADPFLLQQVILNLINNAAEAMHGHGGHRRIEVSSEGKGDRILMAVSDSGPGVPAELRQRIFDPFFTTKKDGSGIGLSICQRIVTDHRGTLLLTTSKWGGAQFVVELPVEKRARPI